ncbi:hypothetical protein PTKIN_Ptkin14bG0003400 [Pterospermum kingtungense]
MGRIFSCIFRFLKKCMCPQDQVQTDELSTSTPELLESLNDANSSIDMVEENDQGVSASAHVLGSNNLEEETENRAPERWLQHYCSSHKMLLVGEGDFSFSASLAVSFGSATNMVATSLDSRERLLQKYSGAMANLKKLEELGCTIVHEVDATTMSQHALLKSYSFDRIVFNFPHAGFFYQEHETPQIKLHRKLVKGFLWNAYEMVTENGEVHIMQKIAHPFSLWNIEKLAEEVGLGLLNKVPFSILEYPGYENNRGHRNEFPILTTALTTPQAPSAEDVMLNTVQFAADNTEGEPNGTYIIHQVDTSEQPTRNLPTPAFRMSAPPFDDSSIPTTTSSPEPRGHGNGFSILTTALTTPQAPSAEDVMLNTVQFAADNTEGEPNGTYIIHQVDTSEQPTRNLPTPAFRMSAPPFDDSSIPTTTSSPEPLSITNEHTTVQSPTKKRSAEPMKTIKVRT